MCCKPLLTWPLTPCPSPFYLKSHTTTDQTTLQPKEHPAPRPTADCAYANFQRFVNLVEELRAVGSGLSQVEGDHCRLRRDVQALLRTCSDRESWCSEEEDRCGLRLSEALQEFVEVEAGVRTLREDVTAVDASLDRITASYRRRQRRLDALRMDSELLLLSSLLTGGEPQSASPMEERGINKS